MARVFTVSELIGGSFMVVDLGFRSGGCVASDQVICAGVPPSQSTASCVLLVSAPFEATPDSHVFTSLLTLLVAAAAGTTAPPLEDLVFDHVFTVVQQVEPVRAALADAGFVVTPDTSVHEGQGTASQGVLFDNGYLELVWVRDLDELRGADSILAARLGGPAPAAPFGLGMALPEGIVDVPFETREYRPSYFPPGVVMEFGETRADEPTVFVFPWEVSFVGAMEGRPPYTSLASHDNGANRITAVRFHRAAEEASRPFAAALATEPVYTVVDGPTSWLEVELDGGRTRQTVDLRATAGLLVRY